MTLARRLVFATAAVAIVAYAALVRLDAVTMKFGPVERPAWLQSLQTGVSGAMPAWRPSAFVWGEEPEYPHADGPPTRYISDPYTYLGFARQMRSFYAAHFREPLFVLATRCWLWMLEDQDVAVSFASMTFSIAAVAIVLALGWYAFSPWVGLGAAALMAVEYELISWGISGWRDEAFVAIVPLWALAILRVARAPSPAAAALLGGVGGLALLIRITSLTFIVPGLLVIAAVGAATWRTRLASMAIAAVVTLAVAGPYLFNCWRVYGDPLYAISYHTSFYAPAVPAPSPDESVTGFVGAVALARPWTTVDTVAVGLTRYPFGNKWRGFDPWMPGLGRLLSWFALAGLVAFVGSTTGRLLLVVFVTSLVPFSLTWRQLADWRFTEHAYPFYLLASCLAMAHLVTFLRWIWRARSEPRPRLWPAVAFWAGVLVTVGVSFWAVSRLLPERRFLEAAAHGDVAVIEAGRRDAVFFGAGWATPEPQGAITIRRSTAFPSVVLLPLPAAGDYDLRLRVDPIAAPGAAADPGGVLLVFLNGRPVGRLTLGFDPERVGSYDVRLSREATVSGVNRLELVVDASLARATAGAPSPEPGGFKLWYLLVRSVPSS